MTRGEVPQKVRATGIAGILRRLRIGRGDVMVFEAPGPEMEAVDGGLAALATAVQSVNEPGGTLSFLPPPPRRAILSRPLIPPSRPQKSAHSPNSSVSNLE